MMPSRAMACSSRGAPVRLWSPAPQLEKKEPITMTQGEGQARIPMTGLLLTEKPNLEGPHRGQGADGRCWSRNQLTCTDGGQPYLSLRTTPSIQAPKKTTLEMSEHQVKMASYSQSTSGRDQPPPGVNPGGGWSRLENAT